MREMGGRSMAWPGWVRSPISSAHRLLHHRWVHALTHPSELDAAGRLRRTLNRLRYGMPDRYGHLSQTIQRHRARRLLEIGVWDAVHSTWMIEAALKQHRPEEIAYYGFDLFEQADASTIDREISKAAPTMEHVRSVLRPFVEQGVTVHLFRGDTTTVLPEIAPALPCMDLVFIDGGHSEHTVRNDWTWVSRCIGPASVVIFDDYVDPRSAAESGVGVNAVVDALDASSYSRRLLRPIDTFPRPWGALRIAFAEVRLRARPTA
jgi:predicted O-methyltransferase YrrM